MRITTAASAYGPKYYRALFIQSREKVRECAARVTLRPAQIFNLTGVQRLVGLNSEPSLPPPLTESSIRYQ